MIKEYQNVKMTHRFYKKGEHKSLVGHAVLVDMPYVDQSGKMKKDFTVLTQKDLFIAALKKVEWFQNKK